MDAYRGNCRCGQVEVRLVSDLKPTDFQPRSDALTCDFCLTHDGVWISDPRGALDLPPIAQTVVARFASKQVEFHSCVRCDDLIYALFEEAGSAKPVAVIRLALFVGIRAAARPVIMTHFEGEAPAVGRQRRLESWTPVRR